MLAALLLACGAAGAAAGAARTDQPGERARFVAAFKHWVPVLVTDQRRVYAVTRTFLKNPDDTGNVLAAVDRLDSHRKQATSALAVIQFESNGLFVLRNRMTTALGHSVMGWGTSRWRFFVKSYYAAAHAPAPLTSAQKRGIISVHDEAEELFRKAWRELAIVDVKLGRPLAPPPVPAAPRVSVPTPVDPIVGSWKAAGGVIEVTATGAAAFEGTLMEPFTFCRSGSVPLGQVQWRITRTAAYTYTGTVRFYKVSDCSYIGDATNATWKYRPADDTLYACSYSPDPGLPGGGCSTLPRVKE